MPTGDELLTALRGIEKGRSNWNNHPDGPLALSVDGAPYIVATDFYVMVAVASECLPGTFTDAPEALSGPIVSWLTEQATAKCVVSMETLRAFADGVKADPKCDDCGGTGRSDCRRCDTSGVCQCECGQCGDSHRRECVECRGRGDVRCVSCRGGRVDGYAKLLTTIIDVEKLAAVLAVIGDAGGDVEVSVIKNDNPYVFRPVGSLAWVACIAAMRKDTTTRRDFDKPETWTMQAA